ncbi:MAG: coiled-coil domain-containing protein [Candidatus Cyclobacteriaceae bacterium M2_1C_046]
MAETPENKKSNKTAIIIAILAIIVIIQGIKIYMDHQKKEDLTETVATTEQELATQMQRLTDISRELDEKIAQIDSLGGDIEELQQAKAEVEAELNRTRRANASTIATLRNKVDGYEELLNRKDKEIDRLQKVNEELLASNTELKEEKNVLSTQIQELGKTKEELTEKVKVASQLRAENVNVWAVNRRGKERESPFKNRHIDELKVQFVIPENKVAPVEGKDIMIRIVDQNGDVIFDVDKGSGTFMVDGKEMFYTAKQEILYDRELKKLSFTYIKGSDWEDGIYNIEVYTDDYLMGTGVFQIK